MGGTQREKSSPTNSQAERLQVLSTAGEWRHLLHQMSGGQAPSGLAAWLQG